MQVAGTLMRDLFKTLRECVWLEGDPGKDQSRGLLCFGVFEMILGGASLLGAFFLFFLCFRVGLGGMKGADFGMLVGALFTLSGWFFSMGWGSIRARRWARALVLVGAWVAVFLGTLASVLLLHLLPSACRLIVDSGVLSPQKTMTLLYAVMVSVFVLQLVFPVATIMFYSLRGVRATCERRNPKPCWTDGRPLPLLSMGFVSVLCSLSVFFGATTNYSVFVFGRVLFGWQGFVVVLLMAGACVYVGWGAVMRRIHAWWVAYALVLLSSASMMLTFSGKEMDSLYRAMRYTEEQIAELYHLNLFSPASLTFAACSWGILACIFLVWVRDCFLPEREIEKVKSYQQRQAEEQAANPPKPLRPRMRVDQ